MLDNLSTLIFFISLIVWGILWFVVFIEIYRDYEKDKISFNKMVVKFIIHYIIFITSSCPAVYILYMILLESY